jgi:uncharacterized cupin superfamily protein
MAMAQASAGTLKALDGSFVAGRPEDVALEDAPINPAWIVSGAPRARAGLHSPSVDGRAETKIWDCSAGSFWWTFHDEETVVILEGAVRVTTEDGASRLLKSGDIAYFAQGSRALWEIEDYVRKIAFCRRKYSAQVLMLRTVLGKLRRKSVPYILPPAIIGSMALMMTPDFF